MLIEITGWIGSFMVVLAYALNIYGKISAESVTYYALNITGSACLIINTIYHHAIPSAVVNIVWIFIAILAMVKKRQADL